MISISKDEIERKDDYNEFIEAQDNRIGIDIGIKNNESVKESRMWIITENMVDPDLKQIYNKFKKKLLKGAWGISPDPNGKKVFYKNHLYTMNAKEAYEN